MAGQPHPGGLAVSCLSGCFSKPLYVAISLAVRGLEHVAAACDATIGRRRVASAQTEQRLEGGHRLPAPIMPKDELIEVDLELRAADAVIADQPLLEIADRAIGQWHDEPAPFRRAVRSGCLRGCA
jgi:hypothetical protein